MANDLARQRRIQGLATALLAGMAGDLDAALKGDFLGQRPIGRNQRFRFVEELRLPVAARFALGAEQFPQEGVEFLLEEITLEFDDF